MASAALAFPRVRFINCPTKNWSSCSVAVNLYLVCLRVGVTGFAASAARRTSSWVKTE